MADGGEEVDGARGSGTPSTKESVKSLTTQYTALLTVVQGLWEPRLNSYLRNLEQQESCPKQSPHQPLQ
ncbi:hypothetical protein V6N11_050873 [Hibiscus sabdariffa]|uniref:Uncharacterized protein n=1 Tax=Hibiscus sabdariffa TaxID=183260 RepID=A0ABR2TBY9_9ROSI